MAEGGFEAYFHVPQQSRRDKLRVFMAQNNHHHHQPPAPQPPPGLQGCSGLFPLYDPATLSSTSEFFPPPSANYYTNPLSLSAAPTTTSDRHHSSSMGCPSSIINAPSSTSSSSSSTSPSYLDSQVQVPPSFLVNPSSVPLSSNPFLYTTQNLTSCSNQVVGFKPEPLASAGQGSLSLSLSSHYSNSNPQYHQSQASLPLELDRRRYASGPAVYDDKTVTWSGEYVVVNPSGSTSYEVSRSPVPLGPFTGYASILRGSKYLKPAQQLLEELFFDGCGGEDEKSSLDVSVMDAPSDHCVMSGVGLVDDPFTVGRKPKLIAMLEEVYKRYKQYYQQIQAVVASFECVAGLGNATPYANLALKALSKHFKSVKIAITDQLHVANKACGQVGHGKDESIKFGNSNIGTCGQRSLNGSGFIEQRPVWRPQRGLPERAVAVLRTWLFDHFLHPYPTDTDKMMLAKQTGLSRNQVSNWFINARVRLWKPMVEEIHMLETRQGSKDPQIDELNASRPRDQIQQSNSVAPSHPPSRTPGMQTVPPPKCSRDQLPDLPVGGDNQLNYNDLPSQSHSRIGASTASGSGRVSLTLGLHQNNGLASSEPYHIGLGLDASTQGFVMGGFEAQNRQFGRDVIGGQLFG